MNKKHTSALIQSNLNQVYDNFEKNVAQWAAQLLFVLVLLLMLLLLTLFDISLLLNKIKPNNATNFD